MIKDESLKLWREYFQNIEGESPYDENFSAFLDDIRKKEEEKSSEVLQPWLHLLEDSIQWLFSIWTILDQKFNKNEENNELLLSVWSLLSSSCSYAVTVRLLVKSGLDNPARGAVRALDEHLCTCISILNTPELAKGFQMSQCSKDASQFWYENFNTKRLNKHLNKVEKSVGIEMHISKEFRDWREDELNTFSQTVHPTYISGVLTARVLGCEDPEKFAPGIFGKLNIGSERTLTYACQSIWYFSRFGFLILFNEHNDIKPLIKFEKSNEMHQVAVIGRDVISKLNMKYWEYSKYS